MRAGVCSVQQALTAEAANLVKQAVGLARRRGHAQVTPLHVASAMLASSTSLLRRACLQSHSHPLQFRALELCFNVALNRLPASTSSPLLGPHTHTSHHPSLSNALVAAFKRAQAHQRRGSIENQQQPILALKIELEHLIISILDDPSVSRVMREAGFSSTQVKNKVEQTVSLEICCTTTSQTTSKENSKPQALVPNVVSHSLSFHNQVGFGFQLPQDIDNVLNTVLNKRKNTVIIGESLGRAESVVRGVMDKFEKGQVSGDLRYVQFISLPLFSLRNLPKEEVEQKLVELKCLVKNYMGRGVILYLGDLKWISEFWSSYGRNTTTYCPVEHIIMELKRLVCGVRENGKILFLMGIATFQSYIKCKTGHPCLETLWELYPLTISVDHSLSLSLNLESESQTQHRSNKASIEWKSWALDEGAGVSKKKTSFIFDNKESFPAIVSSTSSLPSWLQNYKQESTTNLSQDKDSVSVKDLYKKWNSFGSSASTEEKEADNNMSWPVIFESKRSPKELQFWISDDLPKPDLLSNPNSSPNSASSSEAMEEDVDMDGLNEFKVVNAENLSILCNALEKKVPWHKDMIPEIATTILECRSGIRKLKSSLSLFKHRDRQETWLFFLGSDSEAKHKIARELARLIFGSQTNFVSISLSNFESNNNNKKRKRDESSGSSSYVQRLAAALNENPHRVLFMEDLDQLDYSSHQAIKQAIETGKVTLSDGETVPLKDGIIIFTCDSETFTSVSRKGPQEKEEKKTTSSVSLDLNIAIEDHNCEDGIENSGIIGDMGILEYMDNQIIFRVQQL
ncbi:hypothetical protein CCACVL1_22664 [Corchorus capsularis]|uniref:Clp R domain-containing protein n=1 Tax=Corchorus capsularis TaxID=210143 RepID=A0A1R3GXI3_COCAP|nr:hypothetical protein CCACVL1_22664 [Corchorus capsularis]